MAVQYDPIAKDESLNTTESPSRNIADVLAEELSGIASALTPAQLSSLADVTITSAQDGQTLKYDSVSQKWVNANDAGGHTIENPSGTDMPQRANLQFADAHLTDDSVNDRTEVENIKDITSADYASATEDGFYNVTDESDEELTAADIPYDANDSIKEKIDELDEEVNRGSVSVTADGVKNLATLLNTLFSLVNVASVTNKTILEIDYGGGSKNVYMTIGVSPTAIIFSMANVGADVSVSTFTISANGSSYKQSQNNNISDYSTTVPTSGRIYKLYY